MPVREARPSSRQHDVTGAPVDISSRSRPHGAPPRATCPRPSAVDEQADRAARAVLKTDPCVVSLNERDEASPRRIVVATKTASRPSARIRCAGLVPMLWRRSIARVRRKSFERPHVATRSSAPDARAVLASSRSEQRACRAGYQPRPAVAMFRASTSNHARGRRRASPCETCARTSAAVFLEHVAGHTTSERTRDGRLLHHADRPIRETTARPPRRSTSTARASTRCRRRAACIADDDGDARRHSSTSSGPTPDFVRQRSSPTATRRCARGSGSSRRGSRPTLKRAGACDAARRRLLEQRRSNAANVKPR